MNGSRDDAPLMASKRKDAIEEADAALAKDRGDSLTGSSVTIRRPRAELYACWRQFTDLPRFMENVVRIDRIDDRTCHWVVKAPGGATVEWDSVITEDRPDELIAWASRDGARVPNSGRVDFRDVGERGTVVTATILYDPPAGVLGKLIAKMFQREPALQARRDLRRFKQWMETGEVATAARTREQWEEEQG